MTVLIKCENCGEITDVFESISDENHLVSYYCLECYKKIKGKEEDKK
jgi:predicted nucleic acid-binding Zn ribbon protein